MELFEQTLTAATFFNVRLVRIRHRCNVCCYFLIFLVLEDPFAGYYFVNRLLVVDMDTDDVVDLWLNGPMQIVQLPAVLKHVQI